MIEISVDNWKKLVKGKNKFGAVKCFCNCNHEHDSKKERDRCNELCLLQKSGTITRLKQQPKFILLRGFWYRHEKIRPICYFADFSYFEDGQLVIEDSKGRETDVFKLKKKMLLNKIKNRKRCIFIET